MSPIDLRLFAEHSQKVPGKILTPQPSEQTPLWKNLACHWVDFVVAVIMVQTMAIVFESSLDFLMMTKNVKGALPKNSMSNFILLIIPFMIYSYFFFSYFLNHGQTFGMFLMKKRIQLESQNFFSALKWAGYSTLLCLTGGLFLAVKKDIWNNLRAHDHLYQDLVSHRDEQGIKLVQEIESWKEELPPELEDWQRAA